MLSRLLKNAHLRRYPHPSPCQARGKLIAAGFRLPAISAHPWFSPFRLRLTAVWYSLERGSNIFQLFLPFTAEDMLMVVSAAVPYSAYTDVV